jgi:hypothetical protein
MGWPVEKGKYIDFIHFTGERENGKRAQPNDDRLHQVD